MRSGDVALLDFPFSDLSGSKLRPAVILAAVGSSDFVACQITTKDGSDPYAIPLANQSFSAGSLRMMSYARPGKLFTANRSIISKIVGRLIDQALDDIKKNTIAIIRAG